MKFVIGYYLLQVIVVIASVLLGYFVYDKRFRKNHGEKVPTGFEPTNEINTDPTTGETTRVFYNEETGERFYKKEF